MKLVKKFIVKDIKNFEEENDVSVLSMLCSMSVNSIVELIAIGNSCSKERSAEILDDYLAENDENDLTTALKVIQEELLGIKDENDCDELEETEETDEYETMTDLLNLYCCRMMSLGLTYSEFWSLSTKEIYNIFKTYVIKIEDEMNKSLAEAYNAAALTGAAFAGALPKEVPTVKLTEKKIKPTKIIMDGYEFDSQESLDIYLDSKRKQRQARKLQEEQEV